MTSEGVRKQAFGQSWQPTVVDRFGVWLSWRKIQRYTGSMVNKSFGDFGCGFHATLARRLLSRATRAVLIDVAISPELKADARVFAVEGILPDVLSRVESGSLDVIICTSVLEHLWQPLEALREFHRILRPGGICLLNVPSWRGKRFLEFSAFKLRLSPPDEMDDHKSYYDVRDLWPLLVHAGFRPRHIECFSHKFGLNTFAVCRVPE